MSLKSVTNIRKCLLTNFTAIAVIQLLCFLAGLVMVAKYNQCDPVSDRAIKTSDQLIPYFIQETTTKSIHGILGLFIAAMTCATLSVVSHGLHAVSAIVTYEYVVGAFPKLPDSKLAWIAKVSCCVFGILSYFVTFALPYLGNILEVITTLLSITLSPTFAVFTLGMFFPWANAIGSLLGMITGVGFMLTYAVFQIVAAKSQLLPDQKLCLNKFGCNSSIYNSDYGNESTEMFTDLTSSDLECLPSNWKSIHEDDSFPTKTLSMSFYWFGIMGIFVTLFFGILFSFIFNLTLTRKKPSPISRKYFSPPMLRFLEWALPESYLLNWVEKEGENIELNSKL